MFEKILKYYFFFLCIVIASCTPKPVIQIPDDLENSLGNRYSDYILKLNSAVKGDTSSLNNLIRYSDLYDGAAYEHGWVLIELMRKIGDDSFASALKKMNQSQLDNVNMYLMGGLDMHKKADVIPKNFPKSFEMLGYNKK
ncbi:MAG: hypothetical protein ACK5BO_13130 [Bacteroidota bacterium]|jgi:hypothetical protein